MRPRTGEVVHFSEDPAITAFHPHRAPTSSDDRALVWAVDAAHAPSYWFPRQCPRAMAWTTEETTEADRRRVLGPSATRVHVIEYPWLPIMQRTQVYAYRFDVTEFEPYSDGPRPHAYVAETEAIPLGPPEPIGDLLDLHEQSGIELRVVPSLWPWWHEVISSSLGFSGIRLRNARPDVQGPAPSTPGSSRRRRM